MTSREYQYHRLKKLFKPVNIPFSFTTMGTSRQVPALTIADIEKTIKELKLMEEPPVFGITIPWGPSTNADGTLRRPKPEYAWESQQMVLARHEFTVNLPLHNLGIFKSQQP